MNNRYWSKWGEINGQTVGYKSNLKRYYITDGGEPIEVFPSELDDLIYQLMRLKRKVEGE